MGDILCALSLASFQPLNIAQLVFIKQLCPQTRNLNYCFIFSPEGMLSVSVLRLIKIRICRPASLPTGYQGTTMWLQHFLKVMTKPWDRGLVRYSKQEQKRGGGIENWNWTLIYQQLFKKLKKALPPTRKLPKTSGK